MRVSFTTLRTYESKLEFRMLRRFAAVAIVAVLALGAAFAEEVKGTFVKYADGKLTIKTADDKEKEITIPKELKYKRKDFKSGEETEVSVQESLEKMAKNTGKGGKGFNPTLVLDVEKDTAKSYKVEFNFKKKDDKKTEDKKKDN